MVKKESTNKTKKSALKTKEKKATTRKRTVEKNTVKEGCVADMVFDEVMQTNDRFLGINKKRLFFVFIGVEICFLFLGLPIFNEVRSFLFLFSYISLYIFGIASFVRVNRPLMRLKSIFYMLCSWFIWTGGFILISYFWLYVTHLLKEQLDLFYEAFPIFCGGEHHLPVVQFYVPASILLLSFSFFSIYFYKKLVAKFAHSIFTKTILCFLLSMFVSFALLLSLQYTIKEISEITFCTRRCSPCLSSGQCHSCMNVAKPIIYLYPMETTNVSVKLGAPEKLTHTYPKYVDEWKVRAEPNGNLTDEATGRKYYALYWEGKDADLPHYDDGFVVAKDEVVAFLEEKLAVLGLNEREANEFIIYWLPKLESAPYTFVHFVSQEEQNKNMSLSVQPKPDTIIRVLMAFKSLDKPIEVKEQIFPKIPERNGFTVIEWGGTEINSGFIK